MIYRIHASASRELRQAARWHDAQHSGLGLELLAEFEERLRLALQAPTAGKLEATTSGGAAVRACRLRRFHKYSILLAVVGGVPTVLAFKHSSRRPNYWHDRLR